MYVRDQVELCRYEAIDGERVAGFIQYEHRLDRIWLVHTEVEPSQEGTGAASFLVRTTLDMIRGSGGIVVPTCPFVGGWIRRHPEYADLVDAETLRDFKRSRSRQLSSIEPLRIDAPDAQPNQ